MFPIAIIRARMLSTPLIGLVFLLSISMAQAACPPLPSPTGPVLSVDTETELWNAVNTVTSGTTILVADGTYHLGQNGYYLWIDTPNLTLRSQSGNRDAVIFDDNYSGTEVISIVASHVTISEMTIKRAGTHAIHVMSSDEGDTLNTLIYGMHIIDPGQQAIKINPHAARTHFTDHGTIACSRIELTDAGRAMVLSINGSCYTGGVDGHWSKGWVIRDNIIEGFWCDWDLSEHGVHFWTGSRDTLVERNLFIDNARAVGFGLLMSGTGRTYGDNPCPGTSGYVDHYGGMIRNNSIFAARQGLFDSEYGADTGIALWQACGARVFHNTVAFTDSPFTAIEWRFPNTVASIVNNLSSHNFVARDGASATLSGNLQYQSLTSFVDGAGGDLHLTSTATAAIDQGESLLPGESDEDLDGEHRPIGCGRDVGADEYVGARGAAGSGNWNEASTWEGDILPGPSDLVILNPPTTITLNGNAPCYGLLVKDGACLILSEGGTLRISISECLGR